MWVQRELARTVGLSFNWIPWSLGNYNIFEGIARNLSNRCPSGWLIFITLGIKQIWYLPQRKIPSLSSKADCSTNILETYSRTKLSKLLLRKYAQTSKTQINCLPTPIYIFLNNCPVLFYSLNLIDISLNNLQFPAFEIQLIVILSIYSQYDVLNSH